jgi:hypothetical protein
MPGTGLIVCFIWYSLVDSYKDLNTTKFAVIHELQNQLPVALGTLIAERRVAEGGCPAPRLPQNVACAPACKVRLTVTLNETSCFSVCSLWHQ